MNLLEEEHRLEVQAVLLRRYTIYNSAPKNLKRSPGRSR